MSTENENDPKNQEKQEVLEINPFIIVLLFGLISFFGDVIYEGGRAITPSYLEVIGLSALMVGATVGLAEATGYVLRLISGKIADKTKNYWLFIFLGYGLLISVPLIGVTQSIWLIISLIFLERVAKGLRSPSRDAVFSVLTKKMGPGKAFGFHELMDQLGAITGPFIVLIVIYKSSSYQNAFMFLVFPYLFLVFILFLVFQKTRKPLYVRLKKEEQLVSSQADESLSRTYWLYTLSVVINTLFLFPMALILYLSTSIVEPWQIPLVAIIIQGMDALSAVGFGWLYDKVGEKALAIVFFLSPIPAVLLFAPSSSAYLMFSAIVFGVIFGAQESIYRAAVVKLSSIKKRGTAYGYFNALYGLSIGGSGVIFGFILDHAVSPIYSFIIVSIMQVVAIYFLYQSITSRKEK